MSLTHWLGVGVVFLATLLLLGSRFGGRARSGRELRPLTPVLRLRRAVGETLESGRRLHISLGHGVLTGPQSAAAFIGLSTLERLGRVAAVADHPPVASAGTGSLGLLAQGTLRAAFAESGVPERMHPLHAQITGLTPEAYIAGTMLLFETPHTAAEVLIGHFGPLLGLLADAAERQGSLVVAGTDQVPAQAVVYAAADEPLIGEEVFATTAYLGAEPFHVASLQAQDFLRWLLIAVMVLGSVLKALGVWP